MVDTTLDRYLGLIEAAPDGIVEVDASGKIVLVNSSAERMFGYTRAELLGQGIEMLVPESRRTAHGALRNCYEKKLVSRPMANGLELEARRKDGSSFPVEISLSPVTARKMRHTVAIVRDISGRVEATRRIFELENVHTAKIVRANRLKSEFLANMSHELRSPLHSITGFAELLCEAPEDGLAPKYRRFAAHILRDSRHLGALINDILDLSKIEAGKIELSRERFPVREAIADVIESLSPQLHSKRQIAAMIAAPDLTVDADRLRLRAILINLLSNSIKFTPEKGRIQIAASGDESRVEFSVADNGIGIAGEEQEAIFDPFITVRRGLGEGTGLGLAISRNLVELHGGALSVASKLGAGSVFTFTIPARGMPDPKSKRSRIVMAVKEPTRGNSELDGVALAGGFQLLLCAGIEAAMATAARLQPDVIVIENSRFLAEFSGNRRTAHIPVLLVLDEHESETADASGAAAVVRQPAPEGKLIDVLRSLSDGS